MKRVRRSSLPSEQRTIWRVGLVGVAAALLGLQGCSAEGPREADSLRQIEQSILTTNQLYGDDLPPRTVVLTWDDGPDEHTLALAEYLNQEGVRGTFFINGRRICKTLGQDGSCLEPYDTRACDNGQSQAPVANPIYYPESLLHQMVRLGHRIANHTTDHCSLNQQDNPGNFAFELLSTQEIVDRVICDGLYLFRAPYGRWDAEAAGLAQDVPSLDKLIGPINWDVDAEDWDCYDRGTSVEECGDDYMSILEDRPDQSGIFLLHDRPEFNVGIDGPLRLAQYLVTRLKAEGYQFSTLDELLDHEPIGEMACPIPGGGSAGQGGTGGAGMAGAGPMGGAGGTPTGGSGGSEMGGGGAGGSAGTVVVPPTAGTMNGGTGGAAPVDPGVTDPGPGVTAPSSSGGCSLSRRETPRTPFAALLGLLALFGLKRRRSRAELA